jgi:anti-sigma28 factor (negative regulator of flagellin synthesis)
VDGLAGAVVARVVALQQAVGGGQLRIDPGKVSRTE